MDKNDVLKNIKDKMEKSENCPTKESIIEDIKAKQFKDVKK